MIRTLINWLTLDAQNFIAEVWWILLALWIALVIVGISDVATHTLTRGGKFAWIVTILIVPIAGLFAYCILCLVRADYHMLEFLIRRRKSPRKKERHASAPTS